MDIFTCFCQRRKVDKIQHTIKINKNKKVYPNTWIYVTGRIKFTELSSHSLKITWKKNYKACMQLLQQHIIHYPRQCHLIQPETKLSSNRIQQSIFTIFRIRICFPAWGELPFVFKLKPLVQNNRCPIYLYPTSSMILY